MRAVGAAGFAAGLLVAAVFVVAVITLPLGTIGPHVDAASPSPLPAASPPAVSGAPAKTASPAVDASSLAPTPVPVTGIDVGQLAPDFELRTPEGKAIRLSDLRGKPVWVNFWAPWCPACRTEMPRLEGFYLEHADDGVVILGVGVRDSPESMRAYTAEVAVTYPIVVDGDGAVANAYRALALPVHYWIDRDGIVRDWAFGELPPDLLAASLETILPPSAP